ncbi:hypothetical protein Cantr_08421 [Candida viswanathii]|uniref:PH-like domain-containing protein n=1 Tax=Candida viswanathii TaxID=5486 RepID=A0A367Y350_9ASCO|nr:hypothetical protein Cantr_08421 [Candida viswanathii]
MPSECQQLLLQLQQSTIDVNNNLVEILGVVKPKKSTNSSLASTARGLYTKHTNLLSLLNKTLNNIDTKSVGEIEAFKAFVNEFILWLDDNAVLLFEKYSGQWKLHEAADNTTECLLIGPIMNLTNFISFMDSCSDHLRNPFVLDKLGVHSSKLQEIVNKHQTDVSSKKMNNIKFSNIRTFTSGTRVSNELVSSYFTVDQIMERTGNAKLVLNQRIVELVLLDLIGTGIYNALAILSIDTEKGVEVSRSLVYPPFRVNELSLSHTTDSIELKAIDFLSPDCSSSKSITITCHDSQLLDSWVAKLSTICPLERNNSPVSDQFLLETKQSPPKSLSGFGINVISDSEHKKSMSGDAPIPVTPTKKPFQDLIDSPTLSPVKAVAPNSAVSNNDEVMDGLESSSNSSVTSNEGANLESQFNRTLPLIKKTLSQSKQLDDTREADDDDDKYFQIINRKKLSDECSKDEKHKSSRGEISYVECSPVTSEPSAESDTIDEEEIAIISAGGETNVPYQKSFASSVPDLNKPKQSNLYQLSTGSAVDINNFGKSYKPSFAMGVHNNDSVTSISSTKSSKQRRKSLFSIFRKSSKLSETPGFETVAAPERRNAADTIVEEEAVEKETLMSRSESTLPSSSTIVLEQSATPKIVEEDLVIPQELKDIINEESTLDFYISQSSPKSMKISKWKQKQGKWEVVTGADKLFVKIAINYDMNKCWFIVFKEDYDEQLDEDVDKAVMLLQVAPSVTELRKSSAIDLEINSTNAISDEKVMVMVRCSNGSLANEIHSNVENALGALSSTTRSQSYGSLRASKLLASDNTLGSSMMDLGNPSQSSTYTSFSSFTGSPKLKQRIDADEVYNSCIVHNPSSFHISKINLMQIRLQKQLQGYSLVNVPSSWKILSMYNLNVEEIIDDLTLRKYFHFKLVKEDDENDELKWLIPDDNKFDFLERIGKAGLLVKHNDSEIYMIECRGKREFNLLYEIF